MFETVKIKRVTGEIIEQVRNSIVGGNLKPGDKLPSERDMAKQLGVSRPSLREAIQVLEYTGFVEVVQGSGTFIRDIVKTSLKDPLHTLLKDSDQRYLEMNEFRIEIETWAAGIAAQRITPQEKRMLRTLVHRMQERSREQKPFPDLDTEFHLGIAKACHNSIYYQVANTIFYLFAEVTRLSHEQLFVTQKEREGLVNDHRNIYEAITSGNAAAAKRNMNRHLGKTKRWTERTGILWGESGHNQRK